MKETQTPNIFRLATKELSQDGFFAWLLQWAEVNGEYFICIEDKTNTGRHSNQLARYKKLVEDEYDGKPHTLKFIYLKTGNESLSSLGLIKSQEGYMIIDREMVLEILNTRQVNNDIFNDFRSYLIQLQELTNSCSELRVVNTEESAAQGFFLNLQKLIPEWTDWNYVSNPTGGFWGFWYHWVQINDFKLYIQIENKIKVDLQVKIKIEGKAPSIDYLNQLCSQLGELASKYGLLVARPKKFRLGNTSTLAIVVNALPLSSDEELDMSRILTNLQNLQQVLDEYALISLPMNSNL